VRTETRPHLDGIEQQNCGVCDADTAFASDLLVDRFILSRHYEYLRKIGPQWLLMG
jgi:hypothetical protein